MSSSTTAVKIAIAIAVILIIVMAAHVDPIQAFGIVVWGGLSLFTAFLNAAIAKHLGLNPLFGFVLGCIMPLISIPIMRFLGKVKGSM